jgi:cobaltochelatase CobN
MQKHGFRGAAEIAATLDHLAAFAHLAQNVPSALIDAYFEATLDNDQISDFLREANKEAFDAMWDQFRALREQGLWDTRRNSILARMDALT